MSYKEYFQEFLDLNPDVNSAICANEASERLGFADKEIEDFKLLAEQIVAAKTTKEMMEVKNRAACVLITYKE